MALNAVIERDSKNPTPTIDIKPIKKPPAISFDCKRLLLVNLFYEKVNIKLIFLYSHDFDRNKIVIRLFGRHWYTQIYLLKAVFPVISIQHVCNFF